MKSYLLKTEAERQSGHDRQAWAEDLILQLPKNHDGRNSWLLNYGKSEEAEILRVNHSEQMQFSDGHNAFISKHH